MTDTAPTLADELAAMANGLRGSMWANRDEIIKLFDAAADALRTKEAPADVAAMADERFLAALENSQVKEKFHSPIHMKIKLKIVQVLKDGEWKVKHGGRSVVEVLAPAVD